MNQSARRNITAPAEGCSALNGHIIFPPLWLIGYFWISLGDLISMGLFLFHACPVQFCLSLESLESAGGLDCSDFVCWLSVGCASNLWIFALHWNAIYASVA
jgi:hypothetical protein